MSGADFQIVPYRSSPDVLVAVLRNDVQLMVDFYAAIRPSLQEGKLRALASSGLRRSPFVPGLPTVAEAGVPHYEAVSWNGVWARSGTAPEVIGLLNGAIGEIVGTAHIRERYADLGALTRQIEQDVARAREFWSAACAAAR